MPKRCRAQVLYFFHEKAKIQTYPKRASKAGRASADGRGSDAAGQSETGRHGDTPTLQFMKFDSLSRKRIGFFKTSLNADYCKIDCSLEKI